MSSYRLEKIIRIGQRVDPIILQTIKRYGSAEFRPSLSYHFTAGGKRVRAAIVLMACGAAGGPVVSGVKPAAVVEMIHNYSLVMDDIIDRAEVRRGKPSARVFLGESVALLAAMAYREFLDHLIDECVAKGKVRRLAVEAMTEIIEGERLDLQFEQSGRTDPYLRSHRMSRPSFSVYLDMIGKKTASLFRTAGMMGADAARAEQRVVEALGSFGWNMGLAFQIMDDTLDICGGNTGKQQAKDIIEHKLGNAVILVGLKFMSGHDKRRLMTILGSKRVTSGMAAEARSLIMATPAETSCREIARSYSDRAKRSLSVLKDSLYRRGLEDLCDAMVYRSF
jgi:geranylgeranyl diphosphate synthase type I